MTEEAEQRIGEVIAGRYRLDSLISRGGQGAVFAATDLTVDEAVAVKLLSGARATDPESRERMFREARAMVQLAGTAAVRVLDQKWSEQGELCLILERLIGDDFEQYLEKREAAGVRFELDELYRLLEPIAETLDAAHSAGILHRDVKPANIFVLSDGAGVRLLDFGFAKFVTLRGLTRYGYIAGSPSYIAPEAWSGKSDALDSRVDVYALGAVAFRALAGRAPFQTEKVVDLYKLVISAARPSLHAARPDLPREIDAWVEHALAIDPNERFMTAKALWSALGAVVKIAHESVPTPARDSAALGAEPPRSPTPDELNQSASTDTE